MWIVLTIIALLVVFTSCYTSLPKFGRKPKGERKERVLHSPNYRDKNFQNLNPTPQLTGDKGRFSMMKDFLFKKKVRVKPEGELPAIKTDLLALGSDEDVLVWFGHSSTFLQIDGKKILIDPVFSKAASPVSFYNKAFKGTNIYNPEDMPAIDYLVLSHDHWDHLDYPTIKALRERIDRVICPLGVGEHLERWGFDLNRITEMDWEDEAQPEKGIKITCLPARHFSGRSFSPNQSLWASFMFEMPGYKLYIGGDGGYDDHFARIGERFGEVDLAIMENGQYDEGWRYIHMMPEEAVQAARDVRAKSMIAVHNSKFALANHPWDEPLKRVTAAHNKGDFRLLTPMIGEKVNLRDSTQVFGEWWLGIE